MNYTCGNQTDVIFDPDEFRFSPEHENKVCYGNETYVFTKRGAIGYTFRFCQNESVYSETGQYLGVKTIYLDICLSDEIMRSKVATKELFETAKEKGMNFTYNLVAVIVNESTFRKIKRELQ